MTPLLDARELCKHFAATRTGLFAPAGHGTKAVDGVSLTIHPGETLGLVGESGSGKSTLGRMLLRLLEPTSGQLTFDGQDVLSLKGSALLAFRRRAQFIFQDPFSSLNPRHTVETILAEPLVLHDLCPQGQIRSRVRELLTRVGLRPDHGQRYPHEFSGGQRQRIGIARALAVEPELIIADEPVSALDVSVQAQILNLLLDLQVEHKLAMLFIAHDLAVVRLVSQRIAVMYRGRLVESGPAQQVCHNPLHPYTRALLRAAPSPQPGAGPPAEEVVPSVSSQQTAGCAYAGRCPGVTAVCRKEIPQWVEKPNRHGAGCHHAECGSSKTEVAHA